MDLRCKWVQCQQSSVPKWGRRIQVWSTQTLVKISDFRIATGRDWNFGRMIWNDPFRNPVKDWVLFSTWSPNEEPTRVGKFKLSINTTSWCLCGQEMVVSDAWLSVITPVCMHATFESKSVMLFSHHFALVGISPLSKESLSLFFYLENSLFLLLDDSSVVTSVETLPCLHAPTHSSFCTEPSIMRIAG